MPALHRPRQRRPPRYAHGTDHERVHCANLLRPPRVLRLRRVAPVGQAGCGRLRKEDGTAPRNVTATAIAPRRTRLGGGADLRVCPFQMQTPLLPSTRVDTEVIRSKEFPIVGPNDTEVCPYKSMPSRFQIRREPLRQHRAEEQARQEHRRQTDARPHVRAAGRLRAFRYASRAGGRQWAGRGGIPPTCPGGSYDDGRVPSVTVMVFCEEPRWTVNCTLLPGFWSNRKSSSGCCSSIALPLMAVMISPAWMPAWSAGPPDVTPPTYTP